MEKKYTDSEVLVKYSRLSASAKVDVLYSAIDYMNQYNGRTRSECIILAMCNNYNLKRIED